jgi:predicted regulator of Ras-like GTPase activity (Roadblock/LC7/MglB family)
LRAVKKALDILNKLAALDGVRAVVLVSGDGLPLESVVNDAALDADELAALARDGAAAARAMVEDIEQGQFIQGVIEYSKGAVLLTNLPLRMTLAVVTSREGNKAALWNAAATLFPEVIRALYRLSARAGAYKDNSRVRPEYEASARPEMRGAKTLAEINRAPGRRN